MPQIQLFAGVLCVSIFPIVFHEFAAHFSVILSSFVLFVFVVLFNSMAILSRGSPKHLFTKLSGRDWVFIITIGITSFIGNMAVLYSFSQNITPAVGQSLLRIEAVFVACGGIILFGEKLSVRLLTVLILIFIGVIIMGLRLEGSTLAQGSYNPMIFMVVLAAILFAGFQLMTKYIINRVDVFTLNVTRSALGAIVFLPFVFPYLDQLTVPGIMLGALSAFIGPFLGRNLILNSIRYLPLNYIGCNLSLTPILTLILQWLLQGTIPSHTEIIGGTIIVLAVLIFNFKRPKLLTVNKKR